MYLNNPFIIWKIVHYIKPEGGKNRGLATELGITKENSRFPHPIDPNRILIWLYDFVHIYKNIRNHLLDDVVQLPCGKIVCSDDFWDLLEVGEAEITDTFHIKEEHLLIQGNDRQSVPKTCQLLRYHSYIMSVKKMGSWGH